MSNSIFTPGKIIAGIASVGAAVALVLWGVPYYVSHLASKAFTAQAATSPHPVSKAEVATNTTKIDTIESTVLRMEAKMDARDAVIMQYFQDRAAAAETTGD